MIDVEDLRRTYGRGARAVEAVAGVTFRVPAGSFVGYAGPNGAGKSTTIKMLTGILAPTAGRVEVLGLEPSRQRRQLAQRLGVVFGQRTQLWWDLPLRDSFDLVARLHRLGRAGRREREDELVELLGLGPLLGSPVRSLSLGQRMRGELAAAVLPDPPLLFLDEPTIGLAVEAKASVRGFLRELNAERGTTVVLTTHDVDDLTELCSRLIIIDRGRVVSDGTVDELAGSHLVDRVVVVDLRDHTSPAVAGTTLLRSQGRRHWLSFRPQEVSAPAVIGRVLASCDVADLSLEPPDIEQVIRRIYRQRRG